MWCLSIVCTSGHCQSFFCPKSTKGGPYTVTKHNIFFVTHLRIFYIILDQLIYLTIVLLNVASCVFMLSSCLQTLVYEGSASSEEERGSEDNRRAE